MSLLFPPTLKKNTLSEHSSTDLILNMANTRKYKYESRVQRLTNRKTVRFSSMREIGLGTLELQRPVGNYNYSLKGILSQDQNSSSFLMRSSNEYFKKSSHIKWSSNQIQLIVLRIINCWKNQLSSANQNETKVFIA